MELDNTYNYHGGINDKLNENFGFRNLDDEDTYSLKERMALFQVDKGYQILLVHKLQTLYEIIMHYKIIST